MIKNLFLPATLLMNKLRFSLKFTLIVVLFFIPLIFLAVNYFNKVNQASQHTEQELLGLSAVKAIDSLQSELINILVEDMHWRSGQIVPDGHQESANSFTKALSFLSTHDSFNETEKSRIQEQLKSISAQISTQFSDIGNTSWTPVDKLNYVLTSLERFNSLYNLVANLKGLNNDPDIDTVILNRLIIERRLEALNLMSRAYGISSYAIGEQEVSSQTFDALSLVSDQLADNMASIQRLTVATDGQDEQLKLVVKADVDNLAKLLDDNLIFLEEQFLIADDITLNDQALNDWMSEQLGLYYSSKSNLYDLLENRLNQRIDSNQTNFIIQALVVTLVILLVVYLFVGMSLSISMTTNSLTNVAKKLANGDTTVKASIRTRDELAEAIRAFNQMAINVHTLLESAQQAAHGVTKQMQEVEKLSHETGKAVDLQLDDTNAITQSISELLEAASVVSENTANVLTSLESATQESNQGKQTIAGALQATHELAEEIKLSVDVINQLSQQSDSINQVSDVIKSIAEQTNLLALNAAIEAARAGDQGRGFAVVADEVRSLAKRTHESTEEIQTTIFSLQEGVKNAVEAMTRSDEKAARSIEESAKLDEALDKISQAIKQIGEQNRATEQATHQQQSIASNIESSLSSISETSKVTDRNVHQSISASQQLAEYVAKLEETISKFKT